MTLIGQKVGFLSVIEKATQGYKCICECWTITIVDANRLRSGRTKSCGCMRVKLIKEAHTRHGKSSNGYGNKNRARIYTSWANMKRRCYGENNHNYKNYGGRGIKVCDRWKNSFENFYKDMGDPPEGMTLDRINNDGDYEPFNCKWSTYEEQNINKRQRTSKNG